MRKSSITGQAAYTARLPPPQKIDEESDYDDESDIGTAHYQPKTEDPGCCGSCCGSYKTIDEILFDIFLRPIVNCLLSYFSQPMSFHLLVYFGGGCIMYRYVEEWEYSKSLYFLTVTATTVGYGDICPVTPLGRAITSVYCLYGISVVLGALTPIMAILHGEWREGLLTVFGSKDQVRSHACDALPVECTTVLRELDLTSCATPGERE